MLDRVRGNKYKYTFNLPGLAVIFLLYPVSFLNKFTEFLRNLFGIKDSGDVPFSLQSGHSFSSESSKAERTPVEIIVNVITC